MAQDTHPGAPAERKKLRVQAHRYTGALHLGEGVCAAVVGEEGQRGNRGRGPRVYTLCGRPATYGAQCWGHAPAGYAFRALQGLADFIEFVSLDYFRRHGVTPGGVKPL